jgi:hypothetical protein
MKDRTAISMVGHGDRPGEASIEVERDRSRIGTMPMRRGRILASVLRRSLVALGACVPVACGLADGDTPVYPVRGTVFYDGKPTPGALVIFHPVDSTDPEATRPHGRADQDGHFTLSTYRSNDGAPAGQYVVTVDWRKVIPGRGGVPSLLPPRYRTPEDSPLRATVGTGATELEPFRIAK